MKVFISWSGDRSMQVAQLLGDWLKSVLQATDPWISTSNIDNGTVWFGEISKTLAEVKVGIFCITPENREKPWILFEAGAISSNLDEGRVINLILGEQTKNDILPPLSQFHNAYPTKSEMKGVVLTINNRLTVPLPILMVEKVFEKYWDDFEKGYQKIMSKVKPETVPEERKGDDILNEILTTVRGFDTRLRNVETNFPQLTSFNRGMLRGAINQVGPDDTLAYFDSNNNEVAYAVGSIPTYISGKKYGEAQIDPPGVLNIPGLKTPKKSG